MKKLLFVFAVVLGLMGVSCMPKFIHPTKSESDREYDIKRCQDISMAYYKREYGNPRGELRMPGQIENASNTRQVFLDCMTQGGWRIAD